MGGRADWGTGFARIVSAGVSGAWGRGSVSRVLYLCGHLSGIPIARNLMRLYPEGPRAASTPPYRALLPMGFSRPAGLPTAGALLPHHFTVAASRAAVSFLCHFPSGRPARTLSGIVPCGARTFLSDPKAGAATQPSARGIVADVGRRGGPAAGQPERMPAIGWPRPVSASAGTRRSCPPIRR